MLPRHEEAARKYRGAEARDPGEEVQRAQRPARRRRPEVLIREAVETELVEAEARRSSARSRGRRGRGSRRTGSGCRARARRAPRSRSRSRGSRGSRCAANARPDQSDRSRAAWCRRPRPGDSRCAASPGRERQREGRRAVRDLPRRERYGLARRAATGTSADAVGAPSARPDRRPPTAARRASRAAPSPASRSRNRSHQAELVRPALNPSPGLGREPRVEAGRRHLRRSSAARRRPRGTPLARRAAPCRVGVERDLLEREPGARRQATRSQRDDEGNDKPHNEPNDAHRAEDAAPTHAPEPCAGRPRPVN